MDNVEQKIDPESALMGATDWIAMPEITAEQSRGARAMLQMSEEELAAAANVGLSTVRSFEAGLSKPTSNSLRSIRLALEAAGVELLPSLGSGPGVRLSSRQTIRNRT